MKIPDSFEKTLEMFVPEINSTILRIIHKKTRADIIAIKNRDDNKVFGITFRTPPQDAKGLPHILEHSVLCGSRKYPVKEPFVELLKGSLQTFLNAFTYPDKTCYPVASTHFKDFHNLIDVYLDAVFFPILSYETFLQEGWHYHLEKQEDPLKIQGVVYNEMKGAYSSPDRILTETVQHSLFPNHPYGVDSGGDPEKIPELTYEEFINFHNTFYHPSNSRICVYGNGDIHQELSWISEYLDQFDYRPVESSIPPVRPRGKFAKIVKSYAISPNANAERKYYATLNWLLPETSEIDLNFSFQILNYILLGMPGSPLRKALIESGLGEDLAGIGLETELRYLYFSTGLKGLTESGVDSMVSLIDETLRRLVRDGIPKTTVEAAINTIEFQYREHNTGSFPRGLALMLESLTTWLYDKDPFLPIAFESPLQKIKDIFSKNEAYFSELLENYLLENPNKTLVVLRPDPDLLSQLEGKEHARLQKIKFSWNGNELTRIVETTQRLLRIQQQPDRPEDLARIPRLDRKDLDPFPPEITVETRQLPQGGTMLIHPMETNGVAYVDVGFHFHHIPLECLPYLPIFCTALLEMGTDKEDYSTFSERISRKTGGIRLKILTRNGFNTGTDVYALFIRGKALPHQIDDLADILHDMIRRTVFDSKDRLLQIILRHKALRYQRFIPEGHKMALRRIRAHFSLADRVKEELSGTSQYFFVKRLLEEFDKEWHTIRSKLYKLKELLFRKQALLINITADEKLLDNCLSRFGSFHEILGDSPLSKAENPRWDFNMLEPLEGFEVPSQVHYVGFGGKLKIDGDVPGSFFVAMNALRTGWLWEKIRVQGGAYGAQCFLDRASKVFVMTSYRDPNLEKTVVAFKEAPRFLAKEIPEDELVKNIIGAYGRLDPPMFPDAKAYVSMTRFLTGDTFQMRKKLREEIINTAIKDIEKAADILAEWSKAGSLAVFGPGSSLRRAISESWHDMTLTTVE